MPCATVQVELLSAKTCVQRRKVFAAGRDGWQVSGVVTLFRVTMSSQPHPELALACQC
jgi:hypothetical protein